VLDVKVLAIVNCRATPATIALIEKVAGEMGVAIALSHIVVATREDAERYAFPGSPTVLVNGRDIDPPLKSCNAAGGVI